MAITLTGVVFKEFFSGDELSALDLQFFAMNQAVMSFASEIDRDTALTGLELEGMISYLRDGKYFMTYDGSGWVRMGRDLDIAASDTRSSLLFLYTA